MKKAAISRLGTQGFAIAQVVIVMAVLGFITYFLFDYALLTRKQSNQLMNRTTYVEIVQGRAMDAANANVPANSQDLLLTTQSP